MEASILELREKYRLEWENLAITYINQGYPSFEARHMADARLQDEYSEETNDDE